MLKEMYIGTNANFAAKWLKIYIWDKVFKNGPSKICGRQPLKNLKEYGLLSLSTIFPAFTAFTAFVAEWLCSYM